MENLKLRLERENDCREVEMLTREAFGMSMFPAAMSILFFTISGIAKILFLSLILWQKLEDGFWGILLILMGS